MNLHTLPRLGGITGHLGVNGTFPRNERILRKYSCYIRQEEIHQHFLTVDELLELVAQLKLPPSTTKEERQKLVRAMRFSLALSLIIHLSFF